MNPALVILVILAVIILWFLLSFLYKPIGEFILRIFKHTMDDINENDKEKKEGKD